MNKICLAILDGYGIAEKEKIEQNNLFKGSLICEENYEKSFPFFAEHNELDAVQAATNKKFIRLFRENPYTFLYASGEAVGLPKGQMGNSEVGHLNIGAGVVVEQQLLKISRSFENGEIGNNKVLTEYFNNADVKHHVIGLISNGNVHSSIEHLIKIMYLAKEHNVKLFIHAITDGRDTTQTSGIKFIKQLEEHAKICGAEIVSISGRYYAMDRENNLERTQKYFDTITTRQDINIKAEQVLEGSYSKNVTDEFVLPTMLNGDAEIEKEDKVLFFNFRADRMRQIVEMFINKTNCDLYSFIEYKKEFTKVKVLFKTQVVQNGLSETLSKKGLRQFKTAEFSKYAHVTYFFNGEEETPFPNEDRVMAPMVNVPTFDLAPKMSANKVTKNVLNAMKNNYDFICVNYANCDMVGHTGNFTATCKAVKTVTTEVLKLYKMAKKMGYILLVTADHGNADVMYGEEKSTHTTNRVPFLILNCGKNIKLKNNGALCNIAPTILELMQI